MDNAASRFFDVCAYLSPRVAAALHGIPAASAVSAEEIRLRAGMPLVLYISGRPVFVDVSGNIGLVAGGQAFIPHPADIHDTFLRLCEYSVHSRQEELRHGFLTLPGGHRAGLCGTAVYQNGEISTLKELSSVNIRIAREFPGCAAPIMSALPMDFSGLLLAGRPGRDRKSVV